MPIERQYCVRLPAVRPANSCGVSSSRGRLRRLASAGLILWLCGASALARAGTDWMIRGGFVKLYPKAENGRFEYPDQPGIPVGIDIQNSAGFSVEITRMLSERWAVELFLSSPFEHEVKFEHSPYRDRVGYVATVRQLSPALSLQYHLGPFGRLRPYVGAGVVVTEFFDESTEGLLDGRELHLDDAVGAALQLGLDVDLNERYFANVVFRYLGIDSAFDVDGIELSDVKFRPWGFSLHVGYRF